MDWVTKVIHGFLSDILKHFPKWKQVVEFGLTIIEGVSISVQVERKKYLLASKRRLERKEKLVGAGSIVCTKQLNRQNNVLIIFEQHLQDRSSLDENKYYQSVYRLKEKSISQVKKIDWLTGKIWMYHIGIL